MTRLSVRRCAAFIMAGVLAISLGVACGGGDDNEGNEGNSTPAASGGSLAWDAQSLSESEGGAPFVPTILPTSLGVGPSRMLFALIDRDAGTLVSGAEITATYYRLPADPDADPTSAEEVASLDAHPRVLDLRAVAGEGEASDADLTTVYSTNPEFDASGFWGVSLNIDVDGETYQPRMKFWVMEQTPEIAIGSPAPRSEQATLADVDDPATISSEAEPTLEMLDETVAEALDTGKPVVVAFVTPAFCVSRFCGPIMDKVVQPAFDEYGDRVEFVHIEPYDVPKARAEAVLEPVPAVEEWGLRSEPFIFVIDSEGIVRTKLEGVTDLDELSTAIEAVLPGGA